MPRDSKEERQLKLDLASRHDSVTRTELPGFTLLGTGKAGRWLVFHCGREECGKLFALRDADTHLALKICPHCFRSGKLPLTD